MKNKLIISLFTLFILLFTTAGVSHASTSVRLQQPASPTNKDTFNITFVTLDTNSSQTVIVQCYKKAPTDAGFTPFGSNFSLANGGNTGNCEVNSGIMNQGNGTYSFYVTANGTGSVTSSTVNVEFNNSKPGQPVNYSKEKPDSCTYKISFRTANDSGKTVKVVLYRSSDRNFTLDSGHQVNQVSIGSDTDGSMTDNISPNCNTEYFYAIRAYDIYGNPSDPNGDSNTTTTTINPTGTPSTAQGAIPVNGGTQSVLGAKTQVKGEVLGTESAKPQEKENEKVAAVKGQNPISASVTWVLNHKKLDLLVIIIVAAIAYFLYRRNRKK